MGVIGRKNIRMGKGDLSFELKWRIEHYSSEIDVSTFKEYLEEVQKYG